MTKAITIAEKRDAIERSIMANIGKVKDILPRNTSMTPDRVMRIAIAAIDKNPLLLDCTPRSWVRSVLECAQLGLDPGGVMGEAALVPVKNSKIDATEVQLWPTYRGYLSLAYRSDRLVKAEARAVREGDRFEWHHGLDEKLEHVCAEHEDRGDITHFYAIARLNTGGTLWEVMTVEEMIEWRNKHVKNWAKTPWKTDFEAMGRKTVLRVVLNLAPKSPHDRTRAADELEFGNETGIRPEIEVVAFTANGAEEEAEKTKSGSLADKLGAEEGPAAEAAEKKPAKKKRSRRTTKKKEEVKEVEAKVSEPKPESEPSPEPEPEKTEPEKTEPEKTEPEKTEPEKTTPAPDDEAKRAEHRKQIIRTLEQAGTSPQSVAFQRTLPPSLKGKNSSELSVDDLGEMAKLAEAFLAKSEK